MIKVGVIGCGHVAQQSYFPALQLLGDRARVVAVFDTLQQRIDEAVAVNPGASGYLTYDKFLAHEGGLDLVFNLTPAPLHRDITARALEAGIDVYTEKPIAATVQEATELSEIARRQGRRLFCAPSTMATARFRWIKAVVERGQVGTPHTIKAHIGGMGPAGWSTYMGDPRVFYKKGVGPLVDVGVYMLHVITGLFGPARSVQANGGIVYPEREISIERFRGEKVTVETPDVLSINLGLSGNRYAHLFASFAMPAHKTPMFELYGTSGTISVHGGQWYNGNGPSDLFEPGKGWQNDVPAPDPLVSPDILGAGIIHAVECIESNSASMLTAEHATHVLEIMNGALASIESGQPVELATTF